MPDPRDVALSRCLLIFCAVRRAALLLGLDTLSEHDYTRATHILIAEGGEDEAELRLPHARRLKRPAGGDWEEVLRAALLPVPRSTPDIEAAEVIELAAGPGMPIARAVAAFWETNCAFPSRTTLERFMAACDARLANPAAGVPWHAYLDEARELLRAEGHEPSDAAPQHGQRVSFRVPSGARIPGALPQRTNRRRPVTRARCLHALERFAAEQLAAEGSPSRQAYLRWRRATDWPAPSSMTRYGGYAKLMQQALQDLVIRSDNPTTDPVAMSRSKPAAVGERCA